MEKLHLLLTNDDGINSHFLHVLARELLKNFAVTVVAPLKEQSWIGRAMSHKKTVPLTDYSNSFGCPAYAIEGTPSDCVNIALGHLLRKRPAAVISGINIGLNVTVPLLLSSGTLGGAIEGASWGLPAFAFSLEIDNAIFEVVKHQNGKDKAVASSLQEAAIHATKITEAQLGQSNTTLMVRNINFPIQTHAHTPVKTTKPAQLSVGSLFTKHTDQSSFQFCYPQREKGPLPKNTDLACIKQGHISHSILQYSLS